MRPSVVATACLVAIMAQGPKHHSVVQAEIESVLEREHAAAPVVSSSGASVDELHALGARRIAMVTPYLKELTRLVAAYIEDAGIEVGDALSLEVSDNRAVAALDPEGLRTHWRRLDLRDCDALVLSACVQMPSLSASEDVERHCGCRRSPPLRQRHGRICAHSTSNRSPQAPANSCARRPNEPSSPIARSLLPASARQQQTLPAVDHFAQMATSRKRHVVLAWVHLSTAVPETTPGVDTTRVVPSDPFHQVIVNWTTSVVQLLNITSPVIACSPGVQDVACQ